MVGNKDILAFIDTGASIPVWTGSVESLKYYYGDCKFITNTILEGFGGDGTIVSDYKLKTFKFGELTYLDFVILVAPDFNSPFDLIVCSPMLDGFACLLDTVPRKDTDDSYENLTVYYNPN